MRRIPGRSAHLRAGPGKPRAGVTVPESLNRHQKRDKDAADWLPPLNECWFAGQVVLVKAKYGLTVDRRERDALAGVLAGCNAATDIQEALWGAVKSHQGS